jgi:hypothetical protein
MFFFFIFAHCLLLCQLKNTLHQKSVPRTALSGLRTGLFAAHIASRASLPGLARTQALGLVTEGADQRVISLPLFRRIGLKQSEMKAHAFAAGRRDVGAGIGPGVDDGSRFRFIP